MKEDDIDSSTEIESGLEFGDWFNQQLHAAVAFEQEDWALQRAARVQSRLQADRPPEKRLIVEIPWQEAYTAYTCPGRYVYVSRNFFAYCANDEQLAFVVAHEISHHDLGHVLALGPWIRGIKRLPGTMTLSLIFHGLASRLYGPERECAADRAALELCLKAGYDGLKCVELFDVLENLALDKGDLDMVYGPDQDSDQELDPNAPWLTKVKIWTWQRMRGYLPIRDRREVLLQHLRSRRPDLG